MRPPAPRVLRTADCRHHAHVRITSISRYAEGRTRRRETIDRVTDDDWTAREREERRALRVPAYRSVELLPADRFSHRPPEAEIAAWLSDGSGNGDERHGTSAVGARLGRSCAGWEHQPTAAEFRDALTAERPNQRQFGILATWANEADWSEHQRAWCEGAYTLRELVEAFHRAGITACRAARWLNHQADR